MENKQQIEKTTTEIISIVTKASNIEEFAKKNGEHMKNERILISYLTKSLELEVKESGIVLSKFLEKILKSEPELNEGVLNLIELIKVETLKTEENKELEVPVLDTKLEEKRNKETNASVILDFDEEENSDEELKEVLAELEEFPIQEKTQSNNKGIYN